MTTQAQSDSRPADADPGLPVARKTAAGGAAVAAMLYTAMGLATPIGLGFGLVMGLTFGAAAVLILVVKRRIVWIITAALNLVVIVGYVALAGMRQPPFEVWGLAIKACQIVSLAGLVFLVARRPIRARVLRGSKS